MDMLLGSLALVAFVLALLAAVVAVHAEGKIRQPNGFDAKRFDRCTRPIWEAGV